MGKTQSRMKHLLPSEESANKTTAREATPHPPAILLTTDEQVHEQTEPADIQALLDTFSSETDRRQRLLKPMRKLQLISAILIVLLAIQTIEWDAHGYGWAIPLYTGMVLLTTCLTALVIPLSRPSRKERGILDELTRSEDSRAIGPLLQRMHLRKRSLRDAQYRTLASLMLRLKADDAMALSESDLRMIYQELTLFELSLYQHMRGTQWDDLIIAMLHAVGVAGDSRALGVVTSLATRVARTSTQRRIRQAAAECLPRLRERVARNESRCNLLSPADDPNAPSSSLLRPAQDTSQTDPSVLLRPSTARGDGIERREDS